MFKTILGGGGDSSAPPPPPQYYTLIPCYFFFSGENPVPVSLTTLMRYIMLHRRQKQSVSGKALLVEVAKCRGNKFSLPCKVWELQVHTRLKITQRLQLCCVQSINCTVDHI